ncbi:MAG: ribosome biogenesis GTP-binding protein YihA/YsxC [Bacteroidaceae bacterium]|nr:ribosome biogenesis GTP-binding protein YihA/YsxC [Bacteroidaceae bacterium]
MNISKAEYLKSSAFISQCPQHKSPEYAFIGRSNVGKSSLINMLTGFKSLAKTSATPGKTLLINHFSINRGEWYLVDLPGYGFAKRSKKERSKLEQMISSYILQREEMTNLFLLIDCRLEPQTIDLEFMEWLGESGIPFSIVFTKADKLSRAKLNENIEAYMRRLSEQWEPLPPYFITSAEKGTGREELLSYIESINQGL